MKTWQKILSGIAAVLLIVTSLASWGIIHMHNALYPKAPRMPAIVDASMPDILSHLETVLRTKAPNVLADLQPGISAEDIAKLEAQYHVQIPDEIKTIYEWHDGSVLNTNRVSHFIPDHRFVPLEEALAERVAITPEKAAMSQYAFYRFFMGHRDSWVSLFSDGAGDGYWFDLKRQPSEGAIFFDFAEDTTYTFFPSAKNLMADVTTCYEEGAFHFNTNFPTHYLEEDFERSDKIRERFGATK